MSVLHSGKELFFFFFFHLHVNNFYRGLEKTYSRKLGAFVITLVSSIDDTTLSQTRVEARVYILL